MKDLILTQVPLAELRQMLRQEIRNALAESALQEDTGKGKRILTIDECAEFTGKSKSHLYKLTSSGGIPHSKRGKRLYFDRREIEQWLLQHKVLTKEELQEKTDRYLQDKTRDTPTKNQDHV